jgi:hypothetical protein
MKRWVRNIHFALCALIVMAGAAPGDKPIAIEVEAVALFKPPATFVVAGDGWKPSDLPVYSYRVARATSSATATPSGWNPEPRAAKGRRIEP